MNWAGVMCLSLVLPSGNVTSWPPYLAETSFHVPTILFSGFASAFFASSVAERADVKATAATRTVDVLAKNANSSDRTLGSAC